MSELQSYEATCFCGAIRYAVSGDPLFAGYCHCQDCRDFGGAPMIAFTLFPLDAFEVLAGEEHLKTYRRVPETPRASCAQCGGGIGVIRSEADPPHAGISPLLLDGFKFEPTMHVFCEHAVIEINDNLPHYKDIPTELGGTGELIAG